MFAGTPLGSGIAAFPFFLAGKILGKKSRASIKKDPLFFLVNIFIIFCLLSVISTPNKLFFLGSFVSICLMLYLVMLESRYIILREAFFKKLLKIFIVCSTISGICGMIFYFGGFGGRARSLFTGENGLGTVMIPAAFGALACFSQASSKKKLLVGFALATIVAGLILSFSRGAWLGLAGGLFIYFVYCKRDRLKVVILMSIIIITFFTYPPLLYRLESIQDLSYPSNQERIYIMEATWEMIKEQPLTGVGIGNYPSTYPDYRLKESQIPNVSFAHNIFLQIWAEAGIGALVSFLAIVVLIFTKGINIVKCSNLFLRKVGIVAFASFVGILIHNQVDCTVYSLHIGPFFLLLAGIIFYAEKLGCVYKSSKVLK